MFLNRLFNTIVVVGLIVVAVFTIEAAVASAPLTPASQRSSAADAARWTGQAQRQAQLAANYERSLAAEAARWTGLAQASGKLAPATAAWDASAPRYAGRAIALYTETGNRQLLPQCLSAQTSAALPQIGDDSWRSEVALCAE